LGIDSDLLFPIEEQKFLNDHIKDSKLFVIESNLGHDGFLTEPDKIGEIISEILSE
jgi:homoserine O-acetyltransferase